MAVHTVMDDIGELAYARVDEVTDVRTLVHHVNLFRFSVIAIVIAALTRTAALLTADAKI